MPSLPHPRSALSRVVQKVHDWSAVPELLVPPAAIVPDDVIDLRDKHQALYGTHEHEQWPKD